MDPTEDEPTIPTLVDRPGRVPLRPSMPSMGSIPSIADALPPPRFPVLSQVRLGGHLVAIERDYDGVSLVVSGALRIRMSRAEAADLAGALLDDEISDDENE